MSNGPCRTLRTAQGSSGFCQDHSSPALCPRGFCEGCACACVHTCVRACVRVCIPVCRQC